MSKTTRTDYQAFEAVCGRTPNNTLELVRFVALLERFGHRLASQDKPTLHQDCRLLYWSPFLWAPATPREVWRQDDRRCTLPRYDRLQTGVARHRCSIAGGASGVSQTLPTVLVG